MPRILLTDPIDPEGEARLVAVAEILRLQAVDDAAFVHAARAADIIIVRRRLPPGLLSGAKRLRAAIRHGAGLDFIDVGEASAAGIAVTNTPDVNANSVAEHAVAMMLAMRRRLIDFHNGLRDGRWSELRAEAPRTQELRGRTLGVVGFGAIGRRVAEICRFGFSMNVHAVRRRGPELPDWVNFGSLDEVLAQSDVVLIACPLTPETTGLIDAHRLALMRPSALLINVARGAIVDEAALVENLAGNAVAGAALDVYETQPLPLDSPLRNMANVMLTPHVAGLTGDSMRAMSRIAVDEALRVLAGKEPENLVNRDAWPVIRERWAMLARAGGG